MSRALSFLILTAILCCAGLEPPLGAQQEQEPRTFSIPDPDDGVALLETRQKAQLRTAGLLEVFHDFSFTDRQPESGIDFFNESVDDSLITWKPVHYDHGNGVAVADVDGDSRLDLYLTTQLGGNQLWRNLGNGRFENITSSAGVALADRIGVTASFADFDNDGDPDLFVTTVRGGNVLFENDGKGKFQDISKAAGVDYVGHSSGVVFFDYDNDGNLDIWLSNVGVYTTEEIGRGNFFRGIDDAFQGHIYPERSELSILYRNLGNGTFENVSKQVGLEDISWTGDATFVDLDHDLFPELYVLNMQGDDHYYVNQAGKKFVDRTEQTFPKTSWGAMGVKFFDYNNDGALDLYVTDMHSDMHDEEVHPLQDEKTKYFFPLKGAENNLLGNSFYEQDPADGSFEEISDLIGAENYWPWGLSTADLNADGWQDVFIASSMNFPFRYAVNSVLLNNRGKRLLDSEFILGVEPRRDGRTKREVFVLDCDGEQQAHSRCAGQSGKFRVIGSLGTRASAIFDFDNDGDLDIVTNEFNDVSQVLVSDLSEKKPDLRWVKIRLQGSTSNRDGLGALVTLEAGGKSSIRYRDGKSGYLSQSSIPMYFGLGEAEKIDRIEVRWPSGVVQTVLPPIAINGVVDIAEKDSAPKSEG